MNRLSEFVFGGWLLIFLLLSETLPAQKNKIDSLERELQLHYSAIDSSRVKFLIAMAHYENNFEPEKAWQSSLEAITISKKIGYKMGLGFAYNMAGLILSFSVNDQVKADKYYDSAIAVLDKMQDARAFFALGHAYNNKGLVASQQDDYKNSLGFYLKALSFYEKSGDDKFQIIAYNNLTNLYRNTQDPEKAFEYAEKAFALTGKIDNIQWVNCAYLNYAFVLMSLGDYKKAETLIFQRKSFVKKIAFPYDLQYYHSYLGYLYYLQGQYAKAKPYLDTALVHAGHTNDNISVCETLGFLIRNQIRLGELTASKKNLEQLASLAHTANSKYHELTSLECYYQWHRRAGNFETALKYSEKAAVLRDSLLSGKNKIHMNYATAKFQAEKADQEISQLQKDNEIKELNIRNRSVLNYIFVCISLLLFVLLMALYFYFKHKQKIAEQEKQFVIMSNLLKGQEKERSRLAKDLHDGIGSILTGVKYSLASVKKNINPENAAYTRVFENSIGVIDTSIKELRRVAYNMMPEALIKFGLDEGLKDFCQFINNSNGLNIHYQSFGLKDRMDNDTEIVLYRIVQELLTNVVKHSYATETYVQLVKDGSRLSISIEDNGKGFDLEKLEKKKSTGWLSLQSRVNYLKGRLEINSILEKGTTVAIEFNV